MQKVRCSVTQLKVIFDYIPTKIYLLKVNNRNIKNI